MPYVNTELGARPEDQRNTSKAVRLFHQAVSNDWEFSADEMREGVEACLDAIRDKGAKHGIRLLAVKTLAILKGQNDRNAHRAESRKISKIRLMQEQMKLAYQSEEGAKILEELTNFVSRPKEQASTDGRQPASPDAPGHRGEQLDSVPDPSGGP